MRVCLRLMASGAVLYRAILALGIFGAAYAAVFTARAGEPQHIGWWLVVVFYYAWTCAPFVMNVAFARKLRHSAPALLILLATMGVVVLGGLYVLWQSLVGRPRAGSGVILVVLPIYQIAITAVGYALARLAARWFSDQPPRDGNPD